jgi:hypothetical protein
MREGATLERTYDRCCAEGQVQIVEEDGSEVAGQLLASAQSDLKSLKEITQPLEKQQNYRLLWSIRYRILQSLAYSIVSLEKVHLSSDECLFSYICVKHEDWEIDWESLEHMRVLEDAIRTDGKAITADTWQQSKLKFELYTQMFVQILTEKLEKN